MEPGDRVPFFQRRGTTSSPLQLTRPTEAIRAQPDPEGSLLCVQTKSPALCLQPLFGGALMAREPQSLPHQAFPPCAGGGARSLLPSWGGQSPRDGRAASGQADKAPSFPHSSGLIWLLWGGQDVASAQPLGLSRERLQEDRPPCPKPLPARLPHPGPPKRARLVGGHRSQHHSTAELPPGASAPLSQPLAARSDLVRREEEEEEGGRRRTPALQGRLPRTAGGRSDQKPRERVPVPQGGAEQAGKLWPGWGGPFPLCATGGSGAEPEPGQGGSFFPLRHSSGGGSRRVAAPFSPPTGRDLPAVKWPGQRAGRSSGHAHLNPGRLPRRGQPRLPSLPAQHLRLPPGTGAPACRPQLLSFLGPATFFLSK